MVHQLQASGNLTKIKVVRWTLGPTRPWRKTSPHPRRHTASSLAPSTAASLATVGAPLVLGWSHTVTSGAYHSANLWFTTLCALSVALGALSYNLMAVLSEFLHVDRRTQAAQSRTYLHGVDVTSSRFFRIPAVLAAVEFAAHAHRAQRRKTGQPYVSHCIETALIVEACLPPAVSSAEQDRHVACIMAAVLHDVLDDTPTDPAAMSAAFGPRVAGLVGQVSKLSQMNQLLRRGKRQGWAQYSPDHFKQLRKLIVDLAFEEPLCVLVKLADRLHNMRTVYVLPPDKAASVAEETLEVWCSLAESLGWDGLKSEMEDLCFAVLQPSTYCNLRAELDRLWSLPSLAVVEEQLGEAEGRPGGSGDELGLKIVQVSGPAAPVRTYTRAAGVRAAAGVTPPASLSGRRRRGWGRGGGGSNLPEVVAEAPPPLPPPAAAAASATDVAVAAAAVPLPLRSLAAPLATGSVPAAATVSAADGGDGGRTAGAVAVLTEERVASPSASYPVAASAAAATTAAAARAAVGTVVAVVASSSSSSSSSSSRDGGGGSSDTEADPGGRATSTSAFATSPYGVPVDSPPLRVLGTLESVDGPLLSDDIVLPSYAAAAGSATAESADGGPSAAPSTSASAAPIDRQRRKPSPPRPPPDDSEAAAAGDAAGGAASPLSDSPPPEPAPLTPLTCTQERLRLILSVVPFESVSFKSLRGLAGSTRRGLEVLDECAALLYNEIQIRSQAGGLDINIQGRLKSLHSVYRKMLRKSCAVAQVYDSRALRVIVDDGDGSLLAEAVESCYRLVGAVHSLWKPIKREFDDYIANPKPSGYQALHTAVRGPGGIPMEVQIKTSSMHELAEYGAAAHWVYKEYTPALAAPGGRRGGGGAGGRRGGRGGTAPVAPPPQGYVGQPVLKVAKDKLRYGVVVAREADGRRLVSAVKLGPTFRPHPTRVPDYSFYSSLLAYTRSKGWQVPGHGDLVLRLEEYIKCDDGRFHRRDHMGYLIPAETITLLEGYEEDAAAAAAAEATASSTPAATAAVEPPPLPPPRAAPAPAAAGGGGAAASGMDGSLTSSVDEAEVVVGSGGGEGRRLRQQMRATFAKTQQLRSMIEWGRDAIGKYASPASDWSTEEVSVLIWPGGQVEHWARGSTAGDVVAAKGVLSTGMASGEGYDGYRVNLLVNVNNRLVPEDTVLNDGDLVILARERVRI